MTTAGRALFPLALVVATLAAYLQVRHHEFLGYDDPGYVIANPFLRLGVGWEGIRRAFAEPYMLNWIPLTSLSLQLDYQLYGLAPAGYLLGNVVLHTLSSLVLYAALARMTGARGRSGFVAAVFALHPLHVESVAWVSERKDVLSGLFFMLGLYAYARFAERPGSRASRARHAAALVLGLLSKPILVVFPFVLLLLDVWPLGRLAGSAPLRFAARCGAPCSRRSRCCCWSPRSPSSPSSSSSEAGAMSALEALPLGARLPERARVLRPLRGEELLAEAASPCSIRTRSGSVAAVDGRRRGAAPARRLGAGGAAGARRAPTWRSAGSGTWGRWSR